MPRPELSERDAADLLRRAAHLQARADESHGPGLTMDEVKRAAEAAGIDPLYVEQAALGAGEEFPPSEPVLGMQTGARRTRVVPGRVSDAEWGKMVATLRRQLGGSGTVETIGDVREWRRAPLRVLVEPEGENTRITATGTWRADAAAMSLMTAFLLLMGAFMAATALVSAKDGMWLLVGLFAALAAGAGAVTWSRYGPKAARVGGKFDRALDALAGIAGSEERREVLAEAPELPAEAGRIDPDLLDAPARLGPEAEGPGRSRVRE